MNKLRKYCRDDISKIENYHDAINSPEQYVLHHRLELTLDGEFAHTAKELMRLGMYFNRPYFELIFLSQSEHARLHGLNQGEEARRKISVANSGTNNGFYGRHHTPEIRRQLSEAKKGRPHVITIETRRKLSLVQKGKPKSLAQRQYMKDVAKAFRLHKASGGTMSWNEFQASFKVDRSEI